MTELHPKNQGFEWQEPPGPNATVSAAQVADYSQVGGFVLADAFTPTEMQAVLSEIDPLEAQATQQLREQPPAVGISRADEIVFSAHLVAQSKALAKFARHPVLQGLCAALLGPTARLYWDQLVYKKPGAKLEFPWHQDNGYTFVEPQQYLTCWVALTDANETNGCPWIAPALHRKGTLKHRWTDIGFQCFAEAEGTQPMPLSAGSIAVFSSLTPHRTGPNLSDGVRKSYILQYAPDGATMFPMGQPSLAANNADWQFPI